MRRRPTAELALFALSLALSASSFPQAFTDAGVSFPTGTDELYHMRRVWYETVRFPARLDFDPYLNFPDGARPVWPFLFDWLVAGLARLLAGSGDQGAVERLVAWLPPVLGAANVAAVTRLGSGLFGRRAGVLAGLLLALLPAHAYNARLGMLDHHVAVTLATTGLMSCGLALLADAPRVRTAVATSIAIGVGLLLWPGFLLQVLVLQAVAIGQLLLGVDRAAAVARSRTLAVTFGLAAAMLTPFCVGQRWEDLGPLSPLVLSWFQPLWFGAGALLLLVAGALWRGTGVGATRIRRLALALALVLGGLAGALLWLPGLRDAVFGAAGWFTKEGGFLVRVAELAPLLWPHGVFDPSLANTDLSGFVWLFPATWLWLAWTQGRGDGAARPWLVLAWSGSFFAAALAQLRFSDLFAPGFVLVLGASLAALAQRIARIRERGPRLAGWLGSAALVLLALLPCAAYHRDPRAESLEMRGRENIDAAAHWLRRETPPTRGYLDASQRPEYGILAAWGDGHRIRYRAERPVVQDNFGIYGGRKNYELAGAYYRATDEERAYAIAQELGVRYVFATWRGSGQDRVRAIDALGRVRELLDAGSMTRRLALGLGGASQMRGLPALARHRMVYLVGEANRRVALFEVVRGALVTGSAPPGEDLSFELKLRNEPGVSRLYRARTQASSDGRYQLRLPYATDARAASSVRATGPYRVRCGDRSWELAVSEDDVLEGRALDGPSC